LGGGRKYKATLGVRGDADDGSDEDDDDDDDVEKK
jgi:hypothetical protein